MTEEWRPVVGFEGLYEVSDLGRVRSLDRIVTYWHRGAQRRRRCYGRIIRPGPHQGGYLSVHLYGHERVKSTTAHVLVAEAFIGPRPSGMEVCHNDGNKKNCRVENLRYDTHLANVRDMDAHGTRMLGEEHPTAKLAQADILAIRERRGELQQNLADEFGCTFSNISAIQRGKSWRHVA